ncbi:MAG: hypothetical protein ACTHN4_04025 [Sphingomicrobium sp.]
MTTSHAIMLLIGVVALGLGLTTLLRPSITRRLLGMPEHEATTYVLRISGMMLSVFGLVLVLFVAAFTATPGAPS